MKDKATDGMTVGMTMYDDVATLERVTAAMVQTPVATQYVATFEPVAPADSTSNH